MYRYYLFIIVLAVLTFRSGKGIAGIEPTSGRFIDLVEYLSVKVPDGPISWNRLYEQGQSQFNQPWALLVFEIESANDSLLRIIRGGDSYEKLGSAVTIFKFGPRTKLCKDSAPSEGWVWTVIEGDFMDFDENGRTLSMGHFSGYSASFVYENNRLIGVNDANKKWKRSGCPL